MPWGRSLGAIYFNPMEPYTIKPTPFSNTSDTFTNIPLLFFTFRLVYIKKKIMSTLEIQDHLHVYSMFSFKDGRKEPGILINKYNIIKGEVEYLFVHQLNMQAYKSAFEKYEREKCSQLVEEINTNDLISIHQVSLSDYKIIMELLNERNQQLNLMK